MPLFLAFLLSLRRKLLPYPFLVLNINSQVFVYPRLDSSGDSHIVVDIRLSIRQ